MEPFSTLLTCLMLKNIKKKTFSYPLFHIIKHRKQIETIDMLFIYHSWKTHTIAFSHLNITRYIILKQNRKKIKMNIMFFEFLFFSITTFRNNTNTHPQKYAIVIPWTKTTKYVLRMFYKINLLVFSFINFHFFIFHCEPQKRTKKDI